MGFQNDRLIIKRDESLYLALRHHDLFILLSIFIMTFWHDCFSGLTLVVHPNQRESRDEWSLK